MVGSKIGRLASWLTIVLPLAGCAGLDRDSTADALAGGAGMTRALIATDDFVLTSFSRITDPGAPVTVYIEGDGLAWLSRTEVSLDPTPRNPVGLRLAALDRSANVLYLARPCQYTPPKNNPRCASAYWTSHRFAEAVVASLDQAITRLLPAVDSGLHLVGYSGGATVAVLLAARRRDVLSLRTVAGNLDHQAVNRHHRVSPLRESLDPMAVAPRLAGLPQLHLVGGRDDVVPPAIAEGFAARVADRRCVAIRQVVEAKHESGWDEAWRTALAEGMPTCRR